MPDDSRHRVIPIRFAPDIAEAIAEAAQQADTNTSAWIRRAAEQRLKRLQRQRERREQRRVA